MNMTLLIVLFFIFDAIVILWVFTRIVKIKGSFNLTVQGMDLKQLAAFSKTAHEEVGRYLQTNYSGDPQNLPHAMQGLVNTLRARAEQEGLTLDSTVLKRLIEASAVKHGVAKSAEIRSALDQAA